MLPGGVLEQASVVGTESFLPPLPADGGGSLLGGSSSQLGFFSRDSASMSDTLDTRRFKQGAKTFMRGGLALEKTLLNSFKTKTSVESRDNESLSSESLGALSVGPGFYRASQFNSLSDEEKLQVNTWNAFKKFAQQQGDKPMDAGSRGLPVSSLISAVCSISKALPPMEVAAIVQSRQYPTNAMLSMQEFRALIASIFSPSAAAAASAAAASAAAAAAAPPRSPIAHKYSNSDGSSPLGKHSDPRDPSAYHRLQQKHRGAASIVFAALPPHVTTDIGTSESLTELDGCMVSTNVVNDAMLAVLRNETRQRKAQIKQSLQSSDPRVAELAAVQLHASIYEPLLKHKVYGMTHGKETAAANWERMKAQRDGRVEREIKRATRCETMEAINRLVLTSEKRAVKKVVELRADRDKQLARSRVEAKKEEELEAAERIRRREQEALEKKMESASILRTSLEEASLLTQSLHEGDLAEKRAAATPFKLNPSSSALLKVPDELVVRVTKARTLEGWKAAKKAEKDFMENTLDARIKRFADAKYLKMFKAADMGPRLAITQLTSAPGGPPFSAMARHFSPGIRDTPSDDGLFDSSVVVREFSAPAPFAPAAPPTPSSPWSRRGSSGQDEAGSNSPTAELDDAYLQSIAMEEYRRTSFRGEDDLHQRARDSPVNAESP